MTNNIKNAFDSIKAEDELKSKTRIFLQNKIKNQQKTSGFLTVKRLTAVTASFILIVFGFFSYNFYYTANAYVDIDVNPSIELAINRFDRVIEAYAYNDEGDDILQELNLKHKNYDEALKVLITTIDQKGYIKENGLVSVTLQSGNIENESLYLTNLKTSVETMIYEHHNDATVDVFSVSSEIRTTAHEHGISPAKYMAITELQSIDPTVTIENCKSHSIGEIKQLTEEHSSGQSEHHEEDPLNGDTDSDGNTNDSDCEESVTPKNNATKMPQTQNEDKTPNESSEHHMENQKHDSSHE